MTKERRLGRGLEALLGRPPQTEEPVERPAAATPRPPADPYAGLGEPAVPAFLSSVAPPGVAAPPPPPPGPLKVDVHHIESNPYQPRQEFDPAELSSLAESLEAHGLLQPVVVRKQGDRFQLIAGERRLRAAIQAGWKEVPVQVVEADDRQMAELAIIENLHRKDLGPLEKAASFQRYLAQYGCTQEELAGRLKLDRSTIANLIRLLELPETIQQALRQGKITQGHARALLPLGDEREQTAFSERIQAEGLSVRQTEALVQEAVAQADAGPLGVVDPEGTAARQPRRVPSQHVAALEQELRAALGAKVSITHNARGRGKLVIHFRSHEEFDRLRRYLCGEDIEPQARAG